MKIIHDYIQLTVQCIPPSPSQIEDGEVHASLDQLGGRVSFTECPESYDNIHMVANMDRHLADCISLENKLSSFEKEMAADPRYIQRVSGHCTLCFYR